MEDINTVEGIEIKKECLNPPEESVMEENPKSISGPKFTSNETYQVKYLEQYRGKNKSIRSSTEKK